MNEKFWILIRILLKFLTKASKGPLDNTSALIQVMAWRLFGTKSLPEPMLLILLTYICDIMGRCVDSGLDICKFGRYWTFE